MAYLLRNVYFMTFYFFRGFKTFYPSSIYFVHIESHWIFIFSVSVKFAHANTYVLYLIVNRTILTTVLLCSGIYYERYILYFM